VDAELAPLHDKIKAAITENSNLPIKYLVDTHFHGEQTGGNAPFHRDGAIIVAQDNVRVRLLAGTTNGLNYNKSPPAHPDAIPTETYVGGTKAVAVRGREALLTHATNAHTDGDSWIYLADANVMAHSTAKCNGEIFGVEENLTRSSVAEYLSGARVEFILDPLDIGI
jgi:glyoxylase-like metal-dependent hydrolase (beta-lactamase superfamily II)